MLFGFFHYFNPPKPCALRKGPVSAVQVVCALFLCPIERSVLAASLLEIRKLDKVKLVWESIGVLKYHVHIMCTQHLHEVSKEHLTNN